MKQITYRQFLRNPKEIFPIPPEGYEVVRQEGNFFIYPSRDPETVNEDDLIFLIRDIPQRTVDLIKQEKVKSTGPIQNPPSEKLEIARQAFEQKTEDLKTSNDGNCEICKRFTTMLNEVTYRDDDLIRTTNRMCPACLSKCKVSGSYIDG